MSFPLRYSFLNYYSFICITRLRWQRRFARTERGSRVLQGIPNPHYVRVRAAEHAPRGPFQLLELRHGFAEIIERGDGVIVERPRVSPPHPKRDMMILSKNTACHAHRFAQQCLGFFEALQLKKTPRVVVGSY